MLTRIDARRPRHRAHPGRPARTRSATWPGTGLMAMVEPFISHRVDGRIRNELTAEAMIRAMTVAAGLGNTSAYTWLKVPDRRGHGARDGRHHAARADPRRRGVRDPDKAFASWSKALALPTVVGLVIGRSLLFPPNDDVAGAVDAAVSLL